MLSHYRYGNLSWEAAADAPANTIDFHYQQAWRKSAFSGANAVGDVVTEGDYFNYGDGPGGDTIYLKILSINTADDYFVAETGTGSTPATFTPGFRHTYSSTGLYTAGFSSCCRISTLQNNHDGDEVNHTLVNVGGAQHSPVSALAPITQVPDNTNFSFQVPAISPDNDLLSFRFATSVEASGGSGYVLPPNMTINQTGVLTWDVRDSSTTTKPGDLWTAQVIVEAHDRKTGALKSQIPLDFLLEIVSPTAQPPVFDSVPGSVLTPVAGQTLTFLVQASDPGSDDPVSLQALNAPAGMTFTPVAPAPGSRPSATAIQASFTPTAVQAGQTFVVTFQATNSAGLNAQATVTISPAASPAPTVTAMVNDGSVQRSMVTSLTFTFSKVVTIDPGAFSLTSSTLGVLPVTLGVNTSVVNGVSVANLTFSGAGIIAGSLEDGRYEVVLNPSAVHDSLGQTLTGPNSLSFWRLFGDIKGTGLNDNQDLFAFQKAYNTHSGDASYVAAFDFNGDGVINATDLTEIMKRRNKKI